MKTLDPKKLIITYGDKISGFADGSFVTIEPASDIWTKTTGADGLSTRVRQNDNTYRITITLMQSSDSNKFLGALSAADKLSGASVLPIMIKDLTGTEMFAAPEAWIALDPGKTSSKDVENREWVIDTGEAVNLF